MAWRAFEVGDFFVFISMKLRSIVFILSLILIEVFCLIVCKKLTLKSFWLKLLIFKRKKRFQPDLKLLAFKTTFFETLAVKKTNNIENQYEMG